MEHSWTVSNPAGLNTARIYIGAAGTQTAGLVFSGYIGSFTDVTEEYNGSSWSNGLIL
jgi:hypothetical protein